MQPILGSPKQLLSNPWVHVVAQRNSLRALPLVPGTRGAKRVLCAGEFLVMLGHYGWVMSLQVINHPDITKHAGRIYLKYSDVRPGCELTPGRVVLFYLYVDADGLGAEDCRPFEFDFPRPFSAHGPAVAPLAAPKAPTPLSIQAKPYATAAATRWPPRRWQPRESTLVPVGKVTHWLSDALLEPPADNFVFNAAALPSEDGSDDCSDDEEEGRDHLAAQPDEWVGLAARCARATSLMGTAAPAPRPSPQPPAKPTKTATCAGPKVAEASTSAGETGEEASDSDSGLEAPPGLQLLPMALRPPPGLESVAVLEGMPPPPGLGLLSPLGVV